ncbi:MAG TPA: hypothetical protein VMZ26_13205 [Pyrinomonadaceae bacterium]|nr:hypothetical protein [Pyrinomonadaceae bacterium]
MDLTNFKANARWFLLEGWTSYVTIAAGLLVVLALVGMTTVSVIKSRAREMTEAHFIRGRQLTACAKFTDQEKVNFINGQRSEITSLGNQHHANAISYFAYFYATYLILTIFGLVAAICLAVITKSGINASSPHLIATFLISTAIVVVYQGSFDVLKQKANIDLNSAASIKYAVLADQIDTFCTTGKISMKDPNEMLLAALPKVAPSPEQNANTQQSAGDARAGGMILAFFVEPDDDQFINYVAWQMDHLRTFAITVDDSKVGSIDKSRFSF